MNFGLIALTIFLICGAVIGMFAIAASSATPYTDTYGNTTTAETNQSQMMVVNGTAPVSALGGGAAILLAAIGIFVTAIVLIRAMAKSPYGHYRR